MLFVTIYRQNKRIESPIVRKIFIPLVVWSCMVEHENGTRVASHTEYARTRVQCVGCGMSVPVDETRGGRRLCSRCARTN